MKGLKADREVVEWLMSSTSPTVRYHALTRIGGMGEDEPEAARARKDIMRTGPVPKILEKQGDAGCWGRPQDFYMRSKYKGTVWNFIALAELGADGSDPRVRRAADFLLDWSWTESGGFAYTGTGAGGDAQNVIPCLQGNLVWSMLCFGLGEHPKVRRSVDWIAKYQRFDDADGPAPTGWPYERNNCWGRHTCHMGAIKALKALSAIPPGSRSAAESSVIERGAEHLLRHRLFKRSHHPDRVAKEDWTVLGFPLFWGTDALEMLEVLTDLGYNDERMDDAVALLMSKRRPDGAWTNERGFDGRTAAVIERTGERSPWITLRTILVLRRLGLWE